MSYSVLDLKKEANQLRIEALKMLEISRSGHIGGSFSIAEILSVLYFNEMLVEPKNPKNPQRDRFVLSKGHCTPTAYSALAHRGYFPVDQLQTFRKIDSHFSGHYCIDVPGVDASTGSLGQGLSVAVGMAMAAKLDKLNYNVYAVCGDGEIQEGQIWEAAMSAGHFKVDNLCLIVDNNGVQLDGRVSDIMSIDPIGEKFSSFGWHVIECNGNDIQELLKAFDEFHTQKVKPTVIVAKTLKGKGVSFFEDKAEWHGKIPTDEQFQKAFSELYATQKKLEEE